ncbi:MAG: sigma-70 family RNA polymerase sigma factor [Candidatus Eisenbacteria bacterium]|uniref:Sigma-70 family RNA polymerase sigma factor n=1 Tax=Eiseniibacteriota bacterium TaxID=2212470 RepID=A0A7Y2H1I1_UNCEI|nr:sigma-70 family RNA polymerase sigma factor [Candidatus Eisenbacteria bacterium]
MADRNNFTELMHKVAEGDPRALDQALPMVYNELRALAGYHLQAERKDHTLQPTALVHEVYLKMLDQRSVAWESRSHFIRIAATQIRRILVDYARARNREKRGGGLIQVTLDEGVAVEQLAWDILDLDKALDKLNELSEEDRVVVELKYFGGLTEPEIGKLLDVNERTVRRRWSFARAWLFNELKEGGPAPS